MEVNEVRKKALHPIFCRLRDISLITSDWLVGCGCASMSLGFFSIFRLTPAFLYCYLNHYKSKFNKNTQLAMIVLVYLWDGLMLFVLVVLGLVLVSSKKIKSRSPLLLHPWALMLLYLDFFFWISLVLWLQLGSPLDEANQPHIAFCVLMYAECVIFGALYYFFATFFIIAELTIIEKCF